MIPIKFKAKLKPTGSSSHSIIIPKAIADILDKEKEYYFQIREVEEISNEPLL